ncbi:MAG: phosphoribosylformylglycinamidine cyclo-ligase [Bdellovibrionales bacterium]|nr:phosphoribosylformylglycinamidine cyclo-ligase [Bdellovibrionales bacterium]
MTQKKYSYKQSGVDIDTADRTKQEMASIISQRDARVLNSLGGFASLIDFSFPKIKHPVLVFKMEEPGSKQLLAAQMGRLDSVGRDLIHHLINDTIMMGAAPVAVQDTIICGSLNKNDVVSLVREMSQACKEQGCQLVGGETSEQPRVIPKGSYILSAACVGVVDRERIVDGSRIEEGDLVLGIASNGIHTNGYTLVRSLLEADPELAKKEIDGEIFLEIALRPHRCYNLPLQQIFSERRPSGLAHITGGGIRDNLSRIIPEGVTAVVNLPAIPVPPIFSAIQGAGSVEHDEMLRTFNNGVGMIIVCRPEDHEAVSAVFDSFEIPSFLMGEIHSFDPKAGKVSLQGALSF